MAGIGISGATGHDVTGVAIGTSIGRDAPPAVITSAVPATTTARRGVCEGGKRCRCSIASCAPTLGSSHG